MNFSKRSILLLVGATVAVALPLDEPKSSLHRLVPRTARYDKSCERKIPNSDKTYREKVGQAFTDASQLALWTQQGKDSNGNAFTESTA